MFFIKKKAPTISPFATKVLNKLKKQRSPLIISFPPNVEVYASLILAVLPYKQHLVLDELNPFEGDLRMQDGRSFLATANLSGVKVAFYSQVLEAETHAAIASYKVALPNYFNYQERRRYPRFRIKHNRPALHIKMPGYGYLGGPIEDLSRQGLSVSYKYHWDTLLKPGQLLLDCKIVLDQKTLIDADLKVINIQTIPGAHATRLGLVFERLGTVDQHALDYYTQYTWNCTF